MTLSTSPQQCWQCRHYTPFGWWVSSPGMVGWGGRDTYSLGGRTTFRIAPIVTAEVSVICNCFLWFMEIPLEWMFLELYYKGERTLATNGHEKNESAMNVKQLLESSKNLSPPLGTVFTHTLLYTHVLVHMHTTQKSFFSIFSTTFQQRKLSLKSWRN